MYGRAAATPDPGRWYDAGLYQEALSAFLGPGYPGQNWSYPPSVLLLAAPFGGLPYLLALSVWTAIGIVTFLLMARANTGMRIAGILLCSPAAALCLISGQSSLLTTSAIVAVFALLDRRPIIAGVLIGCLTLKPQLGVLLPVMLIASERWLVFAAASVTTLLIIAVTTVAFGPEVWAAFITKGLPTQNIVLSDPDGIATPFYPTLFMNLRGVGAPYALAMGLQGLATVAAAGVVWWAFRRRRSADPIMLGALFTACSVAATPYLLSYDTLPLATFALLALATGKLDAGGRLLAKLIFWLPLLQGTLGTLNVPGPALIAPIFAAVVVLSLRRVHAPSPQLRPTLDAA